MRIAFYTLGCKTNQYETQAMEQLLEKAGCEIGSFEEKNDAYVINTCSVTAIADKKNRAMIRWFCFLRRKYLCSLFFM